MKNRFAIIFGVMTFFLMSCKDQVPESFAYGNFESEVVFLSSETMGTILQMAVGEGQKIKKGELIAMIDSTQLYLKLEQLKASRNAVASNLEQLEMQIRVNNVAMENLEKEIRRFGNLFLEKAATKKQMDDLQGQMDILKAQNDGIKAKKSTILAELRTVDIQISQIRDQLRKTRILAPYDCTVLEIYARQGELSTAGRKLVKVADLTSLNLRVFVQGNQLSSIQPGDEVSVMYDGPDGLEKTTGLISWISQEAEFTPKIIQTRDDRVNLVYAVKVRVKNDGKLKIGMPGEMNLE